MGLDLKPSSVTCKLFDSGKALISLNFRFRIPAVRVMIPASPGCCEAQKPHVKCLLHLVSGSCYSSSQDQR